jgi:hypothetical protein
MSRRDMLRQRHRSVSPQVAEQADLATMVLSDPKRMDVPSVGSANYDDRVRETLQVMLGRQGDPLDRGITLRDLIDAGVVVLAPGYELRPGGGAIPINPGGGSSATTKPDLTPPPTPTGVIVTGGMANVFFETDPPTFAMGHGYFVTNVYMAQQTPGQPPPTFDKAVQVYSFTGDVGSWATTPETLFFFWLKWVTRDGVESIQPAGGTNGFSVSTGQNIDRLIAAMTGPGEPFKVVPYPYYQPDGSYIPAGTYTADAYIHNGFIKNAQLGNLVVDDAKMANVNVSKLRAGSLTVGNYISSSNWPADNTWYIDSNGYANFKNITVKGNGTFQGYIYADGGYFNGSISAAYGEFPGGVRGGQYVGWDWPAGSGMGFFLGYNGLLMGNQPAGRPYVYFDANGGTFNISSGAGKPGLLIDSSGSYFSGQLNVTSGGSGARLEITPTQLRVYDSSNNLRVLIGDIG